MRKLKFDRNRYGNGLLIDAADMSTFDGSIVEAVPDFHVIGIIEAGELVAEGSVNDIYRQLGIMRIIHVQAANLTEEAAAKARELAGVESVELQTDRLAIRLHEDQKSIEDLHADLCGLGLRIRMFQPEAMDMETAFMKLTEGKTA